MLKAPEKGKDQRTQRLSSTCLSVEVQPGLVQFQPGLWKSQPSQRINSEVTSALRFAVLPMGYPKALFSTKELSKLLEGQNRALRIGDWRILNRVDKGKQIELTFSVDPLSDEQLKSVGYRLCYGFRQVHIRQRSKHSAEAKNAPATTKPVPAKVAQKSLDSQELPTCSNSLDWLQHKHGEGARRSVEETVLLAGNRGKKRAARGRRRD
ncbi:hypothetical protein ACLKA6_016225 [Drosophila palustris]